MSADTPLEPLLQFLSSDTSISALIISGVPSFSSSCSDSAGEWRKLLKSLLWHPKLTTLAIRDCTLNAQSITEISSLLWTSFKDDAHPLDATFAATLKTFSPFDSELSSQDLVGTISSSLDKEWNSTAKRSFHGESKARDENEGERDSQFPDYSPLRLQSLELWHVWPEETDYSDYTSESSRSMRLALQKLVISVYRHSSLNTMTLFHNFLDPIFVLDIFKIFHRGGRGRAISIGATQWQNGSFLHPSNPTSIIPGSSRQASSSSTTIDAASFFWRSKPFALCTTLQTVSLPGTNLSTEGLRSLLASLMVWKTIRRLDLSSNSFDINGALISEYFSQLPALSALSLAWLPNSKGKSISWLADNTIFPSLKELNLSHCGWEDTSITEFASSLRYNRTITHLYLQGNPMKRPTVLALSEALSINRTISVLNLLDCLPLSANSEEYSKSLESLAFMLRNNFTLSELGLFSEAALKDDILSSTENLVWLVSTIRNCFIVPFTATNSTLDSISTPSAWDYLRRRVEALPTNNETINFKKASIMAFDSLSYRLETNHSLALARNTGSTVDLSAYRVIEHQSHDSLSSATMFFFRPPVFSLTSTIAEDMLQLREEASSQNNNTSNTKNSSSDQSAMGRLAGLIGHPKKEGDAHAQPVYAEHERQKSNPRAIFGIQSGGDPDIARRMLTRSKSSIRFGIMEELNKKAEIRLRNLSSDLESIGEDEQEQKFEISSSSSVSGPPLRVSHSRFGSSDRKETAKPSPPSLSSSLAIPVPAAPSQIESDSGKQDLGPISLSSSSSAITSAQSNRSSIASLDLSASVAVRRHLALESLPLQRTIPFECASVPSNVIRLSLVGLDMTHIPEHLEVVCPQLLHLDLRANRIDRLPESTFSALTLLESLHLAHNNLDSIHCCLSKLKKLRTVSLHHNPLRLVPPEVAAEQSSPLASLKDFVRSRLSVHLRVMRESSKARSDPLADLTRNARSNALHCRMVMLGDAPAKDDINSLIRGFASLGNEIHAAKWKNTNVSSSSDKLPSSSKSEKPKSKDKKKEKDKEKEKDKMKDLSESVASVGSNPRIETSNPPPGASSSSSSASTLSLSYFQTHYQPEYVAKHSPNRMHYHSGKGNFNLNAKQLESLLSQEWAVNWMCYNFSEGVEAAPNLFMAQDMVYMIVVNVNQWSKERIEFWVNMVYEFVGRSNSPSIYLLGTQIDKIPQKDRAMRLKEIMTHFRRVAENFQTHIGCFFLDSTLPSSASSFPYLYGSSQSSKDAFPSSSLSASSTQGSNRRESVSEQPFVVSMPILAAEISERVLVTMRCVKRWPQCLELISRRILAASHTNPPSYVSSTPNSSSSSLSSSTSPLTSTSNSSSSQNSSLAANEAKTSQKTNLLPFFAITALIHHFGVSSEDIMAFVTYLEENGSILYFGRPRVVWNETILPGATSPSHVGAPAPNGSLPPTPGNNSSTSGPSSSLQDSQNATYISSPSSILENLAIVNPMFCCQLFARLSMLEKVSLSIGLVSTDEARKVWKNFGHKRTHSRQHSSHARSESEDSSSSSTRSNQIASASASSSSANLEFEDEIEFEQFWALLEVIGLAIRVKVPSKEEGSKDLTDSSAIKEALLSEGENDLSKTQLASFGKASDATSLAMRLNALDVDSQVEMATRARIKRLSRQQRSLDSDTVEAALSAISLSKIQTKTSSKKNNDEHSEQNNAVARSNNYSSAVYFVPYLLGNRPSSWRRLADTDLKNLEMRNEEKRSEEDEDENEKREKRETENSKQDDIEASMTSSQSKSSENINDKTLKTSKTKNGCKNKSSAGDTSKILSTPTKMSSQSPSTPSPSPGSPIFTFKVSTPTQYSQNVSRPSSTVSLYRRVYTFSKLPFSLFGRLISGMMTVPGCSISSPYNDLWHGRGFDIRMGDEVAQFLLLNEIYLFVDVLGLSDAAMLFTAEQIVFDILEGWYNKEALGCTEWIGFKDEDSNFYYEYKSRVIDAMYNDKKIEFPRRPWKKVVAAQEAHARRQESVDDFWQEREKNQKSSSVALSSPITTPTTFMIDPMELVPDKMMRPWKEHQIQQNELTSPTNEKLGRGAFGSVTLGIYRQTTPVAMKTFDARPKHVLKVSEGRENSKKGSVGHAQQLEALKELQHEVSIMRRLGNHPNLVNMIGWMLSPPTIVLEHLAGILSVPGDDERGGINASSSKYPQTGPPQSPWERCGLNKIDLISGASIPPQPSVPESASFAVEDSNWVSYLRALLDVSLGMRHMHSRNIVHRDLFLYNILLTPSSSGNSPSATNFSLPYVKIIDFGMARVDLNGETGHFNTERWYIMPPELWISDHFTSAGDVFSFSTLIYQLYTARFKPAIKQQDVSKGIRAPLPTLPNWPEGRDRPLTQAKTAERYLREHYLQNDANKRLERLSKASKALETSEHAIHYKLHSLYLFEKLLQECWAQDPSERPTFADIAIRLAIIFALWTRVIPPANVLDQI